MANKKILNESKMNDEINDTASTFILSYIVIHSSYRKMLAPYKMHLEGVTQILEVIYHQKKLVLSELCDILGIGKSAASIQVDKLVKAGLVNREQGLEDRRNIYLSLTSEGIKEAKKVLKLRMDVINEKFSQLSSSDIKKLSSSLEDVSKILNKLTF